MAIIIIMAFTSLGYIPLVVINATIIHIPVILGCLFCGPKVGAGLGFLFGLTSFINNTFRASSLSAFVFSPVLAYSTVGPAGIFKSIWICFVPRILVGVIPYFVYIGIKKAADSKHKALIGTILNVIVSAFLFFGVRALFIKLSETKSITTAVIYIISIAATVVVFAILETVTLKKSGNAVAFAYAGVAGAMTNTLLVMGSIFVLYRDAYAKAINIDPDAVLGLIGGIISFNGVIEAIVAAILVGAVGEVLLLVKPVGNKAKKEVETEAC